MENWLVAFKDVKHGKVLYYRIKEEDWFRIWKEVKKLDKEFDKELLEE